jgi:hypothetical protein
MPSLRMISTLSKVHDRVSRGRVNHMLIGPFFYVGDSMGQNHTGKNTPTKPYAEYFLGPTSRGESVVFRIG